MIRIKEKKDCVGCAACVSACPQKCISFKTDEQGFDYPHVEISKCIECGLCERVCPVINIAEERLPTAVYAAKIGNENIWKKSSSGGIFYALASRIIEQGGVVFGARFNELWEVEHSYTETLEGLNAFQGSKYSQSVIGDTYRQAKAFLESGRMVMFTGTPCQIAGLKLFLKKDYGCRLLAVDVVCHGVPSPMVWSRYLEYMVSETGKRESVFREISFRDKRLGWSNFGMKIVIDMGDESLEIFESHSGNMFMRGFLANFYLRPSCYACPAKSGRSHSSITLGDFWGIKKIDERLFDDRGVSLVLVNDEIGQAYMETCKIDRDNADYRAAVKYNSAIEMSVRETKWVALFWEKWSAMGIGAIDYVINKSRPSLVRRGLHKLKRILCYFIE